MFASSVFEISTCAERSITTSGHYGKPDVVVVFNFIKSLRQLPAKFRVERIHGLGAVQDNSGNVVCNREFGYIELMCVHISSAVQSVCIRLCCVVVLGQKEFTVTGAIRTLLCLYFRQGFLPTFHIVRTAENFEREFGDRLS